MTRHRSTKSAALSVVLLCSAVLVAACTAEASQPDSASSAASQSFRYHLTYTLAAEVNARMAMVGEYIGGADPGQFASEAGWTTLERAAQSACSTAADDGWDAARAELEAALQTGVESGAAADSSIFVTALVNAATSQGSYCPDLAEQTGTDGSGS